MSLVRQYLWAVWCLFPAYNSDNFSMLIQYILYRLYCTAIVEEENDSEQLCCIWKPYSLLLSCSEGINVISWLICKKEQRCKALWTPHPHHLLLTSPLSPAHKPPKIEAALERVDCLCRVRPPWTHSDLSSVVSHLLRVAPPDFAALRHSAPGFRESCSAV